MPTLTLRFDPPEDALWDHNAQARVIVDPTGTAPTSHVLRLDYGFFDSAAWRTLMDEQLTLGDPYAVQIRANFGGVSGTLAFTRVQYFDQPAYYNHLLYKDGTILDPIWELRDAGTLTYGAAGDPASANGLMRFVGFGNGSIGFLLISEIIITIPPTPPTPPYPVRVVENGKGPHGGREWFQDDLSGELCPREDARLDDYQRLRTRKDVEEPDRDHLQADWQIRKERQFDPL